MNGKHAALVVLVPAGVFAYVVLLSWLVAELSGWRRLAHSYANETTFEAGEWRFAQAVMRRWRLMKSQITMKVGADRQCLYLRPWPFSMPWFPALRVPWRDVSTQEMRILFWKYCRLRFREQPGIEIRVSEKVMQQVLGSVGGSLANGRFEFPV